MDNECYSDKNEAMKKYTIDFQLALPHMHWQNAAKQAIITCKNNFISGFSTTDTDFSICKWDQLISQHLITLNLLRSSRVNPSVSAYSYLYGQYDFKNTPGTFVIVHEKIGDCTSWVHHGTPRWYVGPSLDHYICIQRYMPTTGIISITDTS